jgi:hypothetical protein
MRDDILAILCPDIHGRDFWKIILEKYDGSVPVIFLGDYLDPYFDEGITPEKALNNFKEIFEFKKKWGDKVILLLGNHDMSYYDKKFRCCRFSYENAEWYNKFLNENIKDFTMCYEINNGEKKILFTHAGIHPEWIAQNYLEPKYDAKYINELFEKDKNYFNIYGYYRGGYPFDTGSPIWADIREFNTSNCKNYDENIIQIVGHTQLVKDFIKINNVYCIDSRNVFVLTKNNEIEEY